MQEEILSLLKKIELIEFPLENGGILYFSPDRVSLLESDEVLGGVLKLAKSGNTPEQIKEKLSGQASGDYVDEIIGSIEDLYKKGLVGPDNSKPEKLPPEIIRLVISNTSACNLACSYCYNQFAENAPSFDSASHLEKDQLKRAMEILADVSGDRRELELLFLGGEPLIRFDLIEEAVRLRKEMKSLKGRIVRIFLITNATLLNREIFDFCSRENVHIKISLDGDRHTHNVSRIYPDGSGSYDDVLSVLPDYFYRYSHPCKAVTATIDSFQSDLPRMVDHFTAMGFNQIELTELYGCSSDCIGSGFRKGAERENDDAILERNYSDLTAFLGFKIRSRQYLNLIPFYSPLHLLHYRIKNRYPCRTGINSIALFSDGRFYPCHHFMGDKDFTLGELQKGIDGQNFRSLVSNVSERAECSRCEARFICGGECYHRSLVEGGGVHSVYEKGCKRRKSLFSHLVKLYHSLKSEDPSSLDWYFSINLYP